MKYWPHSWEQVAIFASTAFLPFCCLRQLDPLKEISAAAMLIVLFLFLYICFDLQGDFAQVQDAKFTRQGFEHAYPIISVAFTAHYNGPRYFSELGDLDQFYCVILLVLVSCLIVYSLFAVRGVMIFGNQTRPDLLNNLHAPWMGYGYLLILVAGFPKGFNGVREAVLQLGFEENNDTTSIRKLLGVSGMLFLSMLGITALLLHFKESLGSILDAKGKIFGFPMVYLGPALFSCRLQQKVGLGDSLLIGICLLMFADVGMNIAEYLDGAH